MCIIQCVETSLAERLAASKASLMLLSVNAGDDMVQTQPPLLYQQRISVSLPVTSLQSTLGEHLYSVMLPCFKQIALKWVCNCLTTGAHVIKGKVYRNYMIDVRLRNDKLFRRALNMIVTLAQVTSDVAQRCLLSAIYNTDDVNDGLTSRAVSEHIIAATDQQQVLPLALIMASARCDVTHAQHVLTQYPVVRQALVATTGSK